MKNLKALIDPPKPTAPVPANEQEAAEVTRNGTPRRPRPDREGQRLVAAHFDADTFKNFKILCAEQGATTQSMVSEAMELLFRKYHKPINDKLTAQAQQRD
jgi:hypothetical protein